MQNRDPRNHIDKNALPIIETLSLAEASTFLRSAPRRSASAGTELIYGTLFHVHKIGRGWIWGQSECQLPGKSFPGYVGWAKASHFQSLTDIGTHKVVSTAAPVFDQANIKSPIVNRLPMNSVLSGRTGETFLETDIGYIHLRHIAKLNHGTDHQDWIAIAESLLGQPYIWGGISSFGLDCSGLVQTALRAFGLDAPRDSDQQAQLGEAVDITDGFSGLKRGDLVFWKGHVGIMSSPTRLLHANAHHMLVASEPLMTAVKRIKENAGPVTAIRRLK